MLEMKFVPACRHFFGLKPDQSLSEFMEECRQLSAKDREEISVGLLAHGIKVVS